jgi:hypothetical protein
MQLEMSWECFRELGINTLDYATFENNLGIMLTEIGISHDQVVRWEMTGQGTTNEQDDDVEKLDEGKGLNISRVKGIDHYLVFAALPGHFERYKVATSSVLLPRLIL